MTGEIDKACGDMQLGGWQSICGAAYRLICVDENFDKDLAPFLLPILDPKYTSVIYLSEAQHKPILMFTYYDILDNNGNPIGRKYTVYYKTYQCVF